MILPKRIYLLIPVFLLPLLIALFLVHPVHADDCSTPDPSAVITDTAPAEAASEASAEPADAPVVSETPATDAAVTAEPSITEVSPASTDTPTAEVTDTPAATPAADGSSDLAGTLANLADSGVALANANGAAVSVVTRDSDELNADGDPYFTVGSVTYRFVYGSDASVCAGIDHCTYSTTPIQAALNAMATYGTPTDRKLYVEGNATSYPDTVVVNGATAGVSGLTGIVGVNTTVHPVTISGTVEVQHMSTGFAISNVSVSNTIGSDTVGIYMHDNNGTVSLTDVTAEASGQDGVGIFINNSGSAVLNRVIADGNGYLGARIETTGTGSVIITNSSFDGNMANYSDGINTVDGGSPEIDGLLVKTTSGSITLNGVSAGDNAGPGAFLSNTGVIAVKNSSFNGNSQSHVMTDLRTAGLAVSGAVVTLDGISAADNGHLSVVGSGIAAVGTTSVTASNLYANRNTGFGIDLYTCLTSTCAAGKITLKNAQANSNDGDGLTVKGNGAITITDATADTNGGRSMDIDNTYAAAPAAIMLTQIEGSSSLEGIRVQTAGAVTINNVIADYSSTTTGLEIRSTGTAPILITISTANPSLYNETSGNNGHGYDIQSHGPITIISLNSEANTGTGGVIDNTGATTAVPVTIKTLDANQGASAYYHNVGGGLTVASNGAITLVNLEVTHNTGTGVALDNSAFSMANGGAVTVMNSTFAQNTPGAAGLRVISRGLIILLNINSTDNSGDGIYLNNQLSGATSGVVINAGSGRGNIAYMNGSNGLHLLTNGPVTITNVDASGNAAMGAFLDNTSGCGNVTITNGYFNNNTNGLSLTTNGAVIWKNGTATNNTAGGARIANETATTTPKTVTITNVSADDNNANGLDITSNGAVLLTDVSASDNSINGATIAYGKNYTDNLSTGQTWYFEGSSGDAVTIEISNYAAIPTVTVRDPNGQLVASGSTSTTFTITSTGLYTISLPQEGYGGAYTISLYTATVGKGTAGSTTDTAYGIVVDNATGTNAGVTLKNTTMKTSSNNSASNVSISSNGAVSVTNVDVEMAGSYGLAVDNTTTTLGTPTVTVTGVNAIENGAIGVYLNSLGAVTVKTAMITGSGDNGLSITNNSGSTAVPVNLSSVTSCSNTTNGITVASKGAVTMTTVTANGNPNDGITITTQGAVTATAIYASSNGGLGLSVSTDGAFTLNKPAAGYNLFNDNTDNGLMVSAGGRVTMTNVEAGRNTTGMEITNNNLTGTGPTVLTNIKTSGNDGNGVFISTEGAVTITGLTSNENTAGWGLRIDQSPTYIKTVAYVYPVLLTRMNTNSNGADGILLQVVGSVTLNKFVSNRNGFAGVGAGVMIVNDIGSHNNPATITINNPTGSTVYNQAIGNNGVGVFMRSDGVVKVTGVVTEDNRYDGLVIYNNQSTATPAVTVTLVYSHNNGHDGNIHTSGNGIYVTSHGTVTISNSLSTFNDWDGFEIYTDNDPITIINSSSLNNILDGIYADFTVTSSDLKLIGSAWFGNDSHNLETNTAHVYIS